MPVIFREVIRDRAFKSFAAALTAVSKRSTIERNLILSLSCSFYRTFFLFSPSIRRFLPPFRIRAFDSTLNSFPKRRPYQRKSRTSGWRKERQKKKGELRARQTGIKRRVRSYETMCECFTLTVFVVSDFIRNNGIMRGKTSTWY